jgi:hypothetical protein
VQVWAVYATELQPPKGAEPIAWLLLTSLPVADFSGACLVVQWYRARWEIESCQSQPVKMAWRPLRLLITISIYLRGLVKREDLRDVDLFPGNHDFFDQTWGGDLAIGKGEAIEVLTEEVAKVLDMRDHVLPVEGVLGRGSKLLQFSSQVVECGGQLLTSELQCPEREACCLRRSQQALALPLSSALTLEELFLLGGERGQLVWFALSPALVEMR